MGSYYPISFDDVLSTQKLASYPESTNIVHGNMVMMYLNPTTSSINGNFSNIAPVSSMTSHSTEMMFISPTPTPTADPISSMHHVIGPPLHSQTLKNNTNNNVGGHSIIPSRELHFGMILDTDHTLQGLSLSLSTQMSTTSVSSSPSFQFQYSNPHAGLLTPHHLLPLSVETVNNNNSHQFSMTPKGVVNCNEYDDQYEHQCGMTRAPFKSKYLKAAQQLLDEIVSVRDANKRHESAGKDQMLNQLDEEESKEGTPSEANDSGSVGSASVQELSSSERQDLQNKLEKLHSMLDQVDRRYKEYSHQMQMLVSSFFMVAGGGGAKAYTTLALKTISRHFRSLRDAISEQIQGSRKSLGETDNGMGGAIPRLRYVDQQIRQQRALQHFGMMRHAWRPQRGLPETDVTILRAWLFEHFLHPYPKDSEKVMLARQAGLTRSQVANWFINARVRLWKPMVEEMYKEEFGDVEINCTEDDKTKLTREKSWGSTSTKTTYGYS